MVLELSLQAHVLAAVVGGFAVLAGVMAAYSGYRALDAYWKGVDREELAQEINQGIALGFLFGAVLFPASCTIGYFG